MRTVLAVVSSRAEYSRYRSAFRAISERPDLELKLVVSGQIPLKRHGNAINVIREDGYEPIERIFQTIEGENSLTMGRSLGLSVIDFVGCLDRLKPDWLLVMGDRFEALALTVAGAMVGVRIAHIQGGEVSGSVDESNRHAITKFSHLHFPSTDRAAEVIRRLGEVPGSIVLTGCPAVDVFADVAYSDRQVAIDTIGGMLKIPYEFNSDLPLVVIMYHPITTSEADQGRDIAEFMAALQDLEATRAIFWPNIDAGADQILEGMWEFQRRHTDDQSVVFLNNFEPLAFARTLANADLIVGNSSAGIREACYFGTPAVNVGDRQHGRLRSSNILDVPVSHEAIREGIESQLAHGRYPVEQTFGAPGAGRRIADALGTMPMPPVQKTIYYPDLIDVIPRS